MKITIDTLKNRLQSLNIVIMFSARCKCLLKQLPHDKTLATEEIIFSRIYDKDNCV